MTNLPTFKYLTEEDLNALRNFVSKYRHHDHENSEFWEEMTTKILLEQLHY